MRLVVLKLNEGMNEKRVSRLVFVLFAVDVGGSRISGWFLNFLIM